MMRSDLLPADPGHIEPYQALSAAEEMLSGLPPIPEETQDETEDAERPLVDSTDDYSVKFLTYAYTIPFRLVAVQQELADVFGFAGSFDSEFIARWETMSAPEQAAFSQSYREYRRLQALSRTFAAADHADTKEASAEDRAGRFVVAHMEGLEEWQMLLRDEARMMSGPVRLEPGPADRVSFPGSAPQSLSNDGGSIAVDARHFFPELDMRASGDLDAIIKQLAPIDDLGREVLDKITESEMAEARRRFLTRVRWMLGLPNQQRMAVALRTTGRKRREIAKVMGISEESVKTHLSRADDDWRRQRAADPIDAKRDRAAGRG